jgi:hypothetical protein
VKKASRVISWLQKRVIAKHVGLKTKEIVAEETKAFNGNDGT